MFKAIIAALTAVSAAGALFLSAGAASASSQPGSIAPGQPGYVRPQGVPLYLTGDMRGTWDGRALWRWWLHDPGDGGSCPARANSYGVSLNSRDWIDLRTTGQSSSCAEIATSQLWTAGVFEARVWFPAAYQGGVADFPAYWMSGPGNLWPRYGEIDAAEAIDGWLTATWHWNLAGPYGICTSIRFPGECPAEAGHRLLTRRAGWYTIDIVRKTSGIVEAWYNGSPVWRISTHYPVLPEKVILDLTNDGPGQYANMFVAWVRIWNYR